MECRDQLGQYDGDEFRFIGYKFETGVVYNIIAPQAQKCPKVGGKVSLEVPSGETV